MFALEEVVTVLEAADTAALLGQRGRRRTGHSAVCNAAGLMAVLGLFQGCALT